MKLFRGRGQFVFPTGQIDPQLLIPVITGICSIAAFFIVRSQVAAETARMTQMGFIQRFGGFSDMIWVKIAHGSVAVIQTGDGPYRTFMAPLGFMLTGFMTFACMQDNIIRSHSRWSFAGALGVLGLTVGIGSLFEPRPHIVTIDIQQNRLCIINGSEKCAAAWPGTQISIMPFRENISMDGYTVEIALRDGIAQTELTLLRYTQAMTLLNILRVGIDNARKINLKALEQNSHGKDS